MKIFKWVAFKTFYFIYYLLKIDFFLNLRMRQGNIDFVVMPAGKFVHKFSKLALPTYLQLFIDKFVITSKNLNFRKHLYVFCLFIFILILLFI